MTTTVAATTQQQTTTVAITTQQQTTTVAVTTKEPETTTEINTTSEETSVDEESSVVEATTDNSSGNNNDTTKRDNATKDETLQSGESSNSSYDTIYVGSTKIKKVKRSKNKKKAKIQYKKVSGVTGYEISYSTNKKFKKKEVVLKTRKTQFVIGKLKASKKYYVRVRAFVIINNRKVYGKWSKKKIIKK